MARNYVQRYRPFERLCHWVVAIAFSILVFSGLGLFDKSFVNFLGLMGGGEQAILIHKIAGVVFAISSVSLSLLHARDSFQFDRDDLAWLKVAGGYLHRGGKSPPMGKYNTGQKLFDICSLFSTLGLAATGWVIWNPLSFPRWLVQVCLAGHSLLFVVMASAIVVHVYLGTVGNPGTLPGMLWGEVSVAWARKHAPKWLAKVRTE